MPSVTTTARDVIRREVPSGHFLRDYVLFEDFSELPSSAAGATVNKHFVYGGDGTPILTQHTGGGVLLSTRTAGTADNDTARLVPAASSNWSKTTTPDLQPVLDIVVKTPAAVTDMQVYAGWKLTGTNVIATDADQLLFLFDTDDTANFGTAGVGTLAHSANWLTVVSVAGNDVAVDTGIPVAAATVYRFTISIDEDRQAHFFIDGEPVLSSGAVYLSPATTLTGALLPQVGVSTRDAGPAVRTLGIKGIRRQLPYL